MPEDSHQDTQATCCIEKIGVLSYVDLVRSANIKLADFLVSVLLVVCGSSRSAKELRMHITRLALHLPIFYLDDSFQLSSHTPFRGKTAGTPNEYLMNITNSISID